MSDNYIFNLKVKDNFARIIPDKSIDLTNAEKMEENLLELLEKKDIKNITLDFERVEKIDSFGLGKILMLNETINEKEGTLKIENVNSKYVRKVFNMVDLHEIINIDM